MKRDKFNAAVHAAVVACLALSATAVRTSYAADTAGTGDASATKKTKDEPLQEVVVTGSLIPQARKETSQPLVTISAEDLQEKGFSSVIDALQHSSFATGSVQGAGTNNSFTQGLETISLFGLNPGYTKFLIDGRPIADYPALYNGQDIVTGISGIPEVVLDHIDVLPGAQSSIYGSDAIAGVVNINLLKHMDGPVVDARYGWTKDGGGNDIRFGVADGFGRGMFNLLAGIQYERIDPIWGYQRELTKEANPHGTTPQTAERDVLFFGAFGQPGIGNYYFEDPANCANLTGQFGGTIGLQNRPGHGQYCGTTSEGFYTLANAQENTDAYLHATADVNSHIQIFADVLGGHDVSRYYVQQGFLGTSNGGPYAYYYDPRTNDLMNAQIVFSPETENPRSHMEKNTANSIRTTLGAEGDINGSDWKYTTDWTYTQNKLTEAFNINLTSKINAYFAPQFGPQMGTDPFYGIYPVYEPDYASFYKPITPAEYQSFTTYVKSYSQTEDSSVRAQVTNSKLFALPGGEAGLAVVLEGGHQSWKYDPAPEFLNGEAYLITSVGGGGDRTRYAGTTELRLPVLTQVTIDLSGRYDDYKVSGDNVDKFTYNIGLEYRPIDKLLVRGRYGTAFKVPTLADEFQGLSGSFLAVTDYYRCAKAGFAPGDLSCPFSSAQTGQVFATTSGNPALQPINATVWAAGLVWSPVAHASFSADYLSWNIKNEVVTQSADQLLQTESDCRLGTLDPTSPSCVAALSQVDRGANGAIVSIYTPKQNLAEEVLDVVALAGNYAIPTAAAGVFTFQAAWTDILKHHTTAFPGDPSQDLFQNPFLSTEFKTKGSLSTAWDYEKFGVTAYFEWYGKSPNYLSTQVNSYDAVTNPGTGKLASWEIVNLSARYQLLPGLTLTGNINNLLNAQPPLDTSYPGQPTLSGPAAYNNQNYNPLGRSYFVGATFKWGK